MRLRLFLVPFLLVGLISLTPLAHASPPDPIWIGGVFDDADSDDVVLAATCADEATDGVTLDAVSALWLVVGGVITSHSTSPVCSVFPAAQGRAPPTA